MLSHALTHRSPRPLAEPAGRAGLAEPSHGAWHHPKEASGTCAFQVRRSPRWAGRAEPPGHLVDWVEALPQKLFAGHSVHTVSAATVQAEDRNQPLGQTAQAMHDARLTSVGATATPGWEQAQSGPDSTAAWPVQSHPGF